MVYVSSFVYCDRLQQITTQNGIQHQVIEPLQSLNLVSVPSNFSFSMLCGISDFDTGKRHKLRIEFVAPDNKSTVVAAADVPVASDVEQKKFNGLQAAVEIRNFIFRIEGIYVTKIFFDDILIGEYKIPVITGGHHAQ
ncbi:MAG: hypothetical protein IJR43_10610 [Synergistaceae bacterium]|nr:hypothetical protein [Synergistaceae bacterium]MBQ3694743.1 hypothetical protein [Synergistaceae bacterium]MBQ9629693.1 hypothetical protein [Synergistaceae bacterium]MBR0250911.1 hypothetical protein [Synergistaceae bacterium]